MQPESGHVITKSIISMTGGGHEYKALPIVPVKVKGKWQDYYNICFA